MGIEMHLWRVAPEHIEDMLEHGCASFLDDPRWETQERNWLLLDEMILAFMQYDTPTLLPLFRAVKGGAFFTDSERRDDYPQYLTVEEVEKLATDLGTVTAKEIRDRFKIVKEKWGLTDESIYAHIDSRIKENLDLKDVSAFDHIDQRFQEIVSYCQAAAENRQAMLLLLY